MIFLRSQKGATLVESIVALALASVILSAIVGMVVSAVSTATLSKSRTTATRYAEEGDEVARKTRDRTDWNTFYNTYVGTSKWYVDSSYNLTTGTGLSTTPFTRAITFTNASNPSGNKDRVQVDILVTWQDNGKAQKVELVTYLTHWSK